MLGAASLPLGAGLAVNASVSCAPAALQSFVLLKNDPPSSAGGSAGGGACSSGCGGAGGADGGAAPNAAPLLPLRLDGVKRITLVGPLANRTGAAGAARGLGLLDLGGVRQLPAGSSAAAASRWFQVSPPLGPTHPARAQSTCWAVTTADSQASWSRHTKRLPTASLAAEWTWAC